MAVWRIFRKSDFNVVDFFPLDPHEDILISQVCNTQEPALLLALITVLLSAGIVVSFTLIIVICLLSLYIQLKDIKMSDRERQILLSSSKFT